MVTVDIVVCGLYKNIYFNRILSTFIFILLFLVIYFDNESFKKEEILLKKAKYYKIFILVRYGVVCEKEIMKGEFIIEYTGEIISYFTLKSRQKTYILKNFVNL